MRPPELKTKVEVEVDDLMAIHGALVSGGDAKFFVRAFPGEAPEIVRRLDTWPELVELLEETQDYLARYGDGSTWDRGDCADLEVDIKRHLARCTEEL